jgi:hypothetical protein
VLNERHLCADVGQTGAGRALSKIPSRLRANGVDSWFTRLRGRASERRDHGCTRPAKARQSNTAAALGPRVVAYVYRNRLILR